MQRIARDCPGTEVTALPNCGHFLQEDQPEQVAELITGFFNRPNHDTIAAAQATAVPKAPDDPNPSTTPNIQNFDPTADILPPPEDTPSGTKAKSTATAYFKSRPIHLTEATGNDAAADLNITVLIALDPQASLLFSFITALSD
jgi:hypothetical protein